MEGEPVEAIRETSRNLLFLNRRRQKDEETDVRRSLMSLRITPTQVSTIATKLKTKSLISASDLKLLQNALVDDPKNVELVLNTHGALRGLVRELTGHEVSKQCAACGCLCNLALGDCKTCCIIAKAAGAYLVAALDTLTTQLAVSCAWTLGNLAGSGERAAHIIAAQGAIAKLCDATSSGSDVRDAALYALTHVAFVLKDDFRPEHLYKTMESLSKIDLTIDSAQLLFILSCHKDFNIESLPELYMQRLVGQLTVSIEKHLNLCYKKNANSDRVLVKSDTETKCCDLVYLIRVLANVNNVNVYSVLVEYFVRNNLVRLIRSLMEIDEDRSLWWLLGNIWNLCGDSLFFEQLISK